MTIGKLRRAFYELARVLRDIQSVRSGRAGRRLVNKGLGRHVVRRVWR